jgi:hypothetical protein
MEAYMAKHEKNPGELKRDRRKIKQVALLWWAQTIYQLAHEACEDTNAYDYCNACGSKDTQTPNTRYLAVIEHLCTAARALNKLKKEPRNIDCSPRLIGKPSPSATNCSFDDECPDDYICEDGTCVYLFPMN